MPEYAIFVSELEEFKSIINGLKLWHKETKPLYFDAFLEGVHKPYLDKTRFGYYVKGQFAVILRTHSVEVEDLEKLRGEEPKDDGLTEFISKEYLVPLDDKRFGVVQRLATRKSINWEHITHHIIDDTIALLDNEGRINGTNYELPSVPIPEREQLLVGYYDLMSIVSKLERDLDRVEDDKSRTHLIVCYTLATISCFTGKDAVVIAPKDMCDNCGGEEKKEESIVVQDCAGNVLEVPAEQPKKKTVRRVKKADA